MQYLPILLLVLEFTAGLYWIGQIFHVLATDVRLFEDHKHKLLWFLVVLLAPLVGAIWFAVWCHQTSKRREIAREEANIGAIADSYRAKKTT